ncbi:unnamed protein product [Ixodes pacificus]
MHWKLNGSDALEIPWSQISFNMQPVQLFCENLSHCELKLYSQSAVQGPVLYAIPKSPT